MLSPDILAQSDPELWNAIRLENQRQEDHVELIASENYVSRAVLAAQGSQLTNKYAEGYPGKRYYGGCEHVDLAESIAIERAKKLFGAPWANVQPHSGSQANQAVYTAVLKPGETILGITRERIRLPGDIAGWLEGRSRFARLGLMIHVTSAFVQPGVSNRQVLEMSNVSGHPLEIHAGVRLCQLVLMRTEGRAVYRGRFADQERP